MQVETRRVELFPLFKDFDRGTAHTRIVTPTQFGRILTMLKVCVNPEDLRLLCRKFADAATGDINYPAFVQCVDKLFVNYTVDRLKDYDCPPACPKVAFYGRCYAVFESSRLGRVALYDIASNRNSNGNDKDGHIVTMDD